MELLMTKRIPTITDWTCLKDYMRNESSFLGRNGTDWNGTTGTNTRTGTPRANDPRSDERFNTPGGSRIMLGCIEGIACQEITPTFLDWS